MNSIRRKKRKDNYNARQIASNKLSEIIVTEEQVKAMFGKFKDFVLKRNIPECKSSYTTLSMKFSYIKTMLK